MLESCAIQLLLLSSKVKSIVDILYSKNQLGTNSTQVQTSTHDSIISRSRTASNLVYYDFAQEQ